MTIDWGMRVTVLIWLGGDVYWKIKTGSIEYSLENPKKEKGKKMRL